MRARVTRIFPLAVHILVVTPFIRTAMRGGRALVAPAVVAAQASRVVELIKLAGTAAAGFSAARAASKPAGARPRSVSQARRRLRALARRVAMVPGGQPSFWAAW